MATKNRRVLVFKFQKAYMLPHQIVRRGGVATRYNYLDDDLKKGDLIVVNQNNRNGKEVTTLYYTYSHLKYVGDLRYRNGHVSKHIKILVGEPGSFRYVKGRLLFESGLNWSEHRFMDVDAKTIDSIAQVGVASNKRKKRRSSNRVPWDSKSVNPRHENPERKLIAKYVKFHSREHEFARETRVGLDRYCDLFDTRLNRIYEAKHLNAQDKHARTQIRAAFGQLYEYKQFFKLRGSKLLSRFHRIGILLNRKPDTSTIAFLRRYRVAVIWLESDGESFSSLPANWTKLTPAKKK